MHLLFLFVSFSSSLLFGLQLWFTCVLGFGVGFAISVSSEMRRRNMFSIRLHFQIMFFLFVVAFQGLGLRLHFLCLALFFALWAPGLRLHFPF